jgi:hypothetical protein
MQDLLREATETHHLVFRIVDVPTMTGRRGTRRGSWSIPICRTFLGARPVELTWMLVQLNKEYNDQKPDEPWEAWYAPHLVAHFTT